MAATGSPHVSLTFYDGDRPEYVDPISREHRCTICNELLRLPKMTQCGHRMDEFCAREYLQEYRGGPAICPADTEDCVKITMEDLLDDRGVIPEIKRLKVYCTFRSRGCKDILQWSKLKQHELKCSFAIMDCSNKELGCPAKLSRAEYDSHVASECPYRLVRCPQCGVMVVHRLLEEHIHSTSGCRMTQKPCPFNCGEQAIPRDQFDQHYTVCKAKPRECHYKEQGCTHWNTESGMSKHMEEAKGSHLTLLLQHIDKQAEEKSQLQESLDKLQREQESLRHDIDEVPRILEMVTADQEKMSRSSSTQERTSTFLQTQVETQTVMIEQIEDGSRALAAKSQMEHVGSQLSDMRLRAGDFENRQSNVDTVQNETRTESLRRELEKQSEQHKTAALKIVNLDARALCNEVVTHTGRLLWKIDSYALRKDQAVNGQVPSMHSQPFYTSRCGYQMCARVYLNGDGIGRDTHLSLFVVIMRGSNDQLLPWPFRQKVDMRLLDQENRRKDIVEYFRPDPTSKSFCKPAEQGALMNPGSGCPLFANHSTIENPPYLVDDTIYILIQIDREGLVDGTGETIDPQTGAVASKES